MTDTFGLTGKSSLTSAALQSSLASKLQARSIGSILYRLTWKDRVTPSGRTIFALRASGARTSVKGYILQGWPTTTTRDHKDTGNLDNSMIRIDGKARTDTVPRIAALAGWPTEAFVERKRKSIVKGNSMGESVTDIQRVAMLCGWNTPTCPVVLNGHQVGNNRYVASVTQAIQGPYCIRGKFDRSTMQIGCYVETLPANQAGGPLNSAHSRWLMGLPLEWENCAPTETASTLKRLHNSAQASKKSAMKMEFDL